MLLLYRNIWKKYMYLGLSNIAFGHILLLIFLHTYIHIYIYIKYKKYIYVCVCIYIYIYMYIYIHTHVYKRDAQHLKCSKLCNCVQI